MRITVRYYVGLLSLFCMLLCGGCSRDRAGDNTLTVGLGDTPYEREDVRREVLSTWFTENIWTVPLHIDGGIRRITFSGEYLLIETKVNEVVAVNRFDGTMAWRYMPELKRKLDFPPIAVQPGVAEEIRHFRRILERKPIELDLELKQPEPQDDAQKAAWKKKILDLKAEISGAKSHLRVLPDIDNVFFIVKDFIYCVERESMKQLWSRRLDFIPSAPPFADRLYLFVPSYDLDRVHALDIMKMGEPITYYSSVAPDSTDCDVTNRPIFKSPNLYFVSQNGYVFCYDTSKRQLGWNPPFKTGGPIRADPVIYEHYSPVWNKPAKDGSLAKVPIACGVELFYSAPPLQVVASDEKYKESRMKEWIARMADEGKTVLPQQMYILFVGSFDETFYAIDADSGGILWKYEVGGVIKTPACARDDTVYVKTENGALFAFEVRPFHKNAQGEIIGEKRSGVVRWRLPLGERFLVKGKKDVYVIGPEGEIYRMDEMTGQIKGRFKPRLLTHLVTNTLDDIFYAATEDGYLYAMREPKEQF